MLLTYYVAIIEMCIIAKKEDMKQITECGIRNVRRCKHLNRPALIKLFRGKPSFRRVWGDFPRKNILMTAKFFLLAFTNNLIIHSERTRVYRNKKQGTPQRYLNTVRKRGWRNAHACSNRHDTESKATKSYVLQYVGKKIIFRCFIFYNKSRIF
jgi:hypothetical protein